MENYAGDPTSYPLTVGVPDDSDTPNASTFGVAPENLSDRTAWLRAHAGAVTINWPPIQFNGDGANWAVFGTCLPVWNDGIGAWLIGGGNYSANALFSFDGINWSALYGVNAPGITRCVAVNPNGDCVLLTSDTSGPENGIIKISQTGSFVTEVGGTSWLYAAYGSTYLDDRYVVWPIGSADAPSYSAGADGLTWAVAGSWVAPSGYTHGVSAATSTSVLIFPSGENTGNYVLSTDGSTWSSQALPSLAIGATISIVGAGYDSVRSRWLFMSSDSSASASILWASSTGLADSWIFVSEIPQSTVSLASVNGEIVCYAANAFRFFPAGSPTEAYRGLSSSDGGETWRDTSLYYFLPGTLVAGEDSMIFFTPGDDYPGTCATKRI